MQQYPPQQYPPQQYPPQQYPPQQMTPQQYPPQQMMPQQYPQQQMMPQQYPPQQMMPQQYPQQQMMPQQVVVQAPPQQIVIIQQQQAAPVVAKKKKGWDRIDRDNLFIKQVFNWTEALTGCQMPSTFKMYPLGKDGDKKGKALFKAKEESSCCERQCYPADCRPFVLRVKLEDDDEELDNENFLRINRPCKCTVLCCNRPEISIYDIEDGKDVYLGKVVAPWTMCNVQLDIFDAHNTLKYTIEASCCQLGFFCHWPCEACQTIDFEIKSPSGEVVATLQKRAPSCIAAMVSETDNFLMHFPKAATKEDKALIMSAVLFADYRFFEEKPKKRRDI